MICLNDFLGGGFHNGCRHEKCKYGCGWEHGRCKDGFRCEKRLHREECREDCDKCWFERTKEDCCRG